MSYLVAVLGVVEKSENKGFWGGSGGKGNSFNGVYGVKSMQILIKQNNKEYKMQILNKKDEGQQKKQLDKDIRKFYTEMSDKYPDLRIAISGSIFYANSWSMRSSMGEFSTAELEGEYD